MSWFTQDWGGSLLLFLVFILSLFLVFILSLSLSLSFSLSHFLSFPLFLFLSLLKCPHKTAVVWNINWGLKGWKLESQFVQHFTKWLQSNPQHKSYHHIKKGDVRGKREISPSRGKKLSAGRTWHQNVTWWRSKSIFSY